MKKRAIFILVLIVSFLIALGGVALIAAVPTLSTLAAIGLSTSLVLPALSYLIHVIFFKRMMQKLNETKLADGQSYFLKHRQQAEVTATALLLKLKRIRRAAAVNTVFLALCSLAAAFFGGMLYSVAKPLMALGVVGSAFLMLAILPRLLKDPALELGSKAIVLTKEDYPLLLSLVERAKVTLGIKKEVTVVLGFDTNASITTDHKQIFLSLGIGLLHLLSENELYAILLHEFSHVTDKHRARFREKCHHGRISQAPYNEERMSFLSYFYALFDLTYLFHYSVYQYASAILEEEDADRAMLTHSSAKDAASALIKLEYDCFYEFETSIEDDISIYAPEEPEKNCFARRLQALLEKLPERSAAWNDMIGVGILANNATHPTLKMRLDALGINTVEASFEENAPAYQAELDKALDAVEEAVYESRKETHEEDRKNRYLLPLSEVTAWEEAGKPILAETYADIISALETLCRFSEAEALADEAMKILPGASSYQAYFTKGCYLLHRYDDAGIDYLYRAIENNHNYLEDGLGLIGHYCCITGKEEALADYRSRALALAQKNKDENDQAGYLNKGDRLSRDDMPEEMREEIISFILSVSEDIIENIYLVRKTISESFFASAFVIHFYGGTDSQRYDIMHKIFRYLDSYPIDWQFSLFDYFEVAAVKVEKIEGSLVYTKNKQ